MIESGSQTSPAPGESRILHTASQVYLAITWQSAQEAP